MAAEGFLNLARFTANAGGTGDFVVSAAVTGYQTPASANAVSGTVYSYRAESADLSEWEIGEGVYTSGSVTLARTTIIASTNGGAKVNFSAAPQVAMVVLAGDLRVNAAPLDALAFNGMQTNSGKLIDQEYEGAAQTLASGVSAYACDGFVVKFATAGTWAFTTQQKAPPGSPSFGGAFQKCIELKSTTGQAVLGSNDYVFLEDWIEGWRVIRIRFGASGALEVTVAGWIYATRTGTATATLMNGASDRSNPTNFTVDAATTWEYKVVTFVGDTSGTWLKDSGAGLKVRWCFGAGSTYQGTNATWTGSEKHATASTSNFFQSNNDVVCMTGTLVLPGIYAPSAAHSPLIIPTQMFELRVAQERYWKTFRPGVRPVQNVGSRLGALHYRVWVAGTAGANGREINIPKMAKTPTFTGYNPFGANDKWYNNSGTADSGTSSATDLSENGCFVENPQAAGDAVGNLMVLHAVLNAR